MQNISMKAAGSRASQTGGQQVIRYLQATNRKLPSSNHMQSEGSVPPRCSACNLSEDVVTADIGT